MDVSKKFGQNFLVDKNKLLEISKSLPDLKNQIVLEVGPGTGNLTKMLIANAKKVIAIEIDEKMIEILNKDNLLSKSNNFELIKSDILKFDIKSLTSKYESIYLVSNLPYYISTKIIFKFLEFNNFEIMAVMLQKELVTRIFANPNTKQFGRLTVAIGSLFSLEKKIDVPRQCFLPIPNVDSGFIILKRKFLDFDYKPYLAFIKDCFMLKRKTILNSLKNSNSRYFEFVKLYLIKNNLNLNIRAEQIKIDEYIKIWKEILKNDKS